MDTYIFYFVCRIKNNENFFGLWQHRRPVGVIRQDLWQTVDEIGAIFRGHVYWLVLVQNRMQNQDAQGECAGENRQKIKRYYVNPNPDAKHRCFIHDVCVNLQLTVIAGWTISSAVLASLIFGVHQVELHPLAAAAYSSLSHTLWALCLSWTVIACATGNGGKTHPYHIWRICTLLFSTGKLRHFSPQWNS